MADTSLGSLIVSVGASVSGFTSAMQGVSQTLDDLGTAATASLDRFDGIISRFGEVAAAAGIATGAIETLKSSLEDFSKSQDVETSFTLLTGSVNDAQTAFEGLKQQATDLAVPFGDLVGAAQKLAPQFGVGTTALQDVVGAAADAAAATGRSFDTITDGLDRIAQTGQASGKQITQMGVSLSDVADYMGVSVSDATALLKKGGEDAQDTVDAVTGAIEEKFGGAAAAMADNLSGQFTNLKNQLGFLSEDLGSALAPLASDLIAAFNDVLPAIKSLIDDGVKPFVDEVQSLFTAIKDGAAGIGNTLSSGDTLAGAGSGGLAGTIADVKSLASELGDLGAQVKDIIANIDSIGQQTGFTAMLQASSNATNGFLNNIISLKGAFDALFPEFQQATNLLQVLNFAMDSWQGKVAAMKDGQDALTKAAQATASAANPWNTEAMGTAEMQLATDKAPPTPPDYTANLAALQALKDAKSLLAETTKLVNQADKDYADFLKSTFVPDVLSVSDATANVQTALENYTKAELAEANARQALAMNPSDVALQNALKDAETAGAAAKRDYTEAIKDQSTANTTLAGVTRDLQSAQDAIASAVKSSYVPALVDHQTALNNITTAQGNVTNAIQDVQGAQANLTATYGLAIKSDDDIKLAEDALEATKRSLKTATDSLTQAHKDETTSLGLLTSAAKEINADELATLATRKLLFPATTDISTALGNYETDLQNVKDASDKLTTSEIALALAQQGNNPQALADATKNAKDARTDLTTATKGLGDATTVLTTNFNLSKDALDLLKQHQDDWTDAQKLSLAAMSDLGIQSPDILQKIADKASSAFQAIQDSGTAPPAVILQAWQDKLQKIQDAYTASGTALSASDQVTLATLKQQHTDFINDQANQWANLYNGIDKDVQGCAASMISTLVSGSGSFHDEMIKALQDIGAQVISSFTKPFSDAIASLLAGGIADLLGNSGLGGISSSLTNIGKQISSVFTSSGSINLGGNSAASIGAAGTGSIGDIVGTGDTLAGVGSSGASAAFSTITSTIASTVSAITGVVSAVTGIIGDFQNAHQQDSLTSIESNTRAGALYTLSALDWLQDIQDFNYNHLFPEVAGINSMLMDFTNGNGPLGSALEALATALTNTGPDYSEYNASTFGDINATLSEILGQLQGQVHTDMTIIEGKLDVLNQSVVSGGSKTGTFSVNGVTQTVTQVGPASVPVSTAPANAPTYQDLVDGVIGAAPWQSFVDAMSQMQSALQNSINSVVLAIGNTNTLMEAEATSLNSGFTVLTSAMVSGTAQTVPRLDQMIQFMKNNGPSIIVNINAPTYGITDLVNQVQAGIATQVRMQGVYA